MTFTQSRGADNHIWTVCDRCKHNSWQINQKLADHWKRIHVCRKDTP